MITEEGLKRIQNVYDEEFVITESELPKERIKEIRFKDRTKEERIELYGRDALEVRLITEKATYLLVIGKWLVQRTEEDGK